MSADKTRERIAAILDPDAFDDTSKRSTRPIAILQWAARRHFAYEGADRIIAATNTSDARYTIEVYDPETEQFEQIASTNFSIRITSTRYAPKTIFESDDEEFNG